jgi:hypothetical protein
MRDVNLKIDLGRKLTGPEGASSTPASGRCLHRKAPVILNPERKLGVKVDNYYEVIDGLKPGERVVTSANFLIDSESSFKEAVGGMTGMDHGSHGK